MKKFVRSGVWVVVVLSAVAIPLALGQPLPPPGGGKVEAAKPRQPGGVFGSELGEYMTVEGVRIDGTFTGTRTLLVDTVNGKKLGKPTAIWVHNLDLPARQRCVLKGYESGEMIGTPPAYLAAAKEEGRKDVFTSQAAWQWHPHFVVLIVAELNGLTLMKE